MGRFEAQNIVDGWTAQEYYEHRELTEVKVPMGSTTGYLSDFPPDGRYKDSRRQPVDKHAGWTDLGGRTEKSLYQADYPGWTAQRPSRRPRELLPASMPFDSTTSYTADFRNRGTQRRKPSQLEEAKPWDVRPFDDTTSYGAAFKGRVGTIPMKRSKEMPPADVPFNARSTYNADFISRKFNRGTNHGDDTRAIPVRKFQSETTSGVFFKGFKLPARRGDLGVETVGNRMHVLVSKQKSLPASGKYVFSTFRDNQKEMCILLFMGNSKTASENYLLGQFDVINIPPMPKQTPQIEVTVNIDSAGMVTAEAKDLDTQRHRLWTQNGGAITVRA